MPCHCRGAAAGQELRKVQCCGVTMRSLTAGAVLAGVTQCHAWRHRSALEVPRRDWGAAPGFGGEAMPGRGREGELSQAISRGATATRGFWGARAALDRKSVV